MSFLWTRLQGTPIWESAISFYEDGWRDYHGVSHLETLYAHAQNTFQFPYDRSLDLAILAHDVRILNDGWDERMSAHWLFELMDTPDLKAQKLILTTIGHRPGAGDTRLALLGLANFMDEDASRADTRKLWNEARNRGVGFETWKKGNAQYLRGLFARIENGRPRVKDPKEQVYWEKISAGISAALADVANFSPEVARAPELEIQL